MTGAVIFDIDGTLVDSVDLHAEAWRQALRHFGFDVPAGEIRTQIGKGGDKLLPVFVPPDVLERQGKDIEKYRGELFREHYLARVKPFPQVRELFQRIRADGQKTALGSSAQKAELVKLKQIAGVADLVDCETSADDVDASKPDPDVFHAAMECLHPVARENVVVVGDTPYDAEAARKAGLAVIGVLCGGFPERDLRAAGCVAIYRDPADLLAQYESSPLHRRKKAA